MFDTPPPPSPHHGPTTLTLGQLATHGPPDDDVLGPTPDVVDRGHRDPPGRFWRLWCRWLPAPPDTGGRRGALIVVVLLGVVVAVLVSVLVLGARPAEETPPPLPLAAATAGPSAASGPPAEQGSVVVSVVGEVRSPGLVTVAPGARVADALDAAGGVMGEVDLATVNLARKLVDGEQIHVGTPPPGAPPPGGASAPAAGATGLVNLNTATVEQLDGLPGVGEVTAQRILDWRAQHGSFTAVEQLREVEGIGEKRFSRLREQVTVG
ncbi:competence protein ComEA [Amycolatopsis arida]|uniref:Competence protein ComEA n=1 Tax=Amycolatopsis arida TaxID=587909 RepID=A0A1I5UTP5_9PSEU|nr:ComEA family DNA-binding protein [Amycolatopsis arida]TDX91030.1 competence protein ComEA [Amycolatopsis arida]SFP98633.1 competence protein ComEA [Amycolatopsis arida]